MPMMPPTGCQAPTCKAYAVQGTTYCEKHTKPPAANEPQTAALPRPPKPWYWKWYNCAHWRALRGMVLARDPVCKACNRYAATRADHIIPHKGNWELFCDMANLQGLCEQCHNTKTALENGGFGNPVVDGNAPVVTGESGKQFSSGSQVQQQNKALQNIDDLLNVQLPGAK